MWILPGEASPLQTILAIMSCSAVAKCGNQVNTQSSKECSEEGKRPQEAVENGELGSLRRRREQEDLSEGELHSDPASPLPLPRATNSLQMIADMYTDDEQ